MLPTTRLILDKRRVKGTGKYPVLLRITYERKCIYKPVKKEFTDDEWKKMWGLKPGELKDTRAELVSFESEAKTVIDNIPESRFSLAEFNNRYAVRDQITGISGSLESHFKKYQAALWSREQVKTSYVYKNALTSLEAFRPGMLLSDITDDLLKDYQFQMVKKEGKSLTTVSMYLRALRTIINKAIDSGDFSSQRKYYPFGRNKFKIPAPLEKKKTLTIEQLTKLANYKPKNSDQAFAKDMFLFSYYCGGPNPIDIAKFKFEWIKDKHIHFPARSKTENTNPNQEPIPPVPIDSELQKIIDKWKLKKQSPKEYVFGILSNKMDARQIVESVNGFNKRINAGLKEIALQKDLKFGCVPTMGYARATQANNLMAAGVSVEEIAKHMGHASPKTTKIYLKQLPDNLNNNTLSKLRLPKLKAV